MRKSTISDFPELLLEIFIQFILFLESFAQINEFQHPLRQVNSIKKNIKNVINFKPKLKEKGWLQLGGIMENELEEFI